MKNYQIKKILFGLTLIVLLLFSNGRFTLFFATWLSTTMLLYVIRKFSALRGFLLAWLLLASAFLFQYYELVPLPTPFYILLMVVYGMVLAIPYLLDLVFIKNKNSFLHTLIFPTSWVLIAYVLYKYNPYGSWLHIAYSQQSQLVLLQSISVFGLGFITFLIGWFASVSNWVYKQRNEWKNVKKGVLIYSIVLGLTLIYGGYRVQFQKANSKTIRIASISALDSLKVRIDIQGLNNKETENDVKIETRKNTSKLNQNLFDRSIKEAEAGAKIVFWAEGNAVILKEDENELYENASQIASNQNIYLGLGVAVIDPTNSKFLENKFVLFDQNGKKVIDYWKGISVPGAEAPISNNKTTGIQKIETNYGTIAATICFDMDFPQYLKQAKGSDILLAPSNDYKAIDPIHTHMASFRAIEQGFNLVRQTSNGLSTGVDYTGKIISEMDHFTDKGKVLITQLPTKGITTIYSIIGDVFIVFCLLLFTVIVIKFKGYNKRY